MTVEPCLAGLGGGEKMTVVAKGAAATIGNRPVRNDQRDDACCGRKLSDAFWAQCPCDRLSRNWTVRNGRRSLAKQRCIQKRVERAPGIQGVAIDSKLVTGWHQ